MPNEACLREGDLSHYRNYIDGTWLEADSGQRFDCTNPATGKVWATIARSGPVDASRAARAAHRAATAGPWATMRPTERGRWLRRIGEAFGADLERLALVESRDNGKRLSEVRAQFADLPEYFHYFAGLADKFEGRVVPIDRSNTFNYTVWQPYGAVAAITAWNSPLALLAWKVAPALASGNTVVIKPSEHASASTLELMQTLSSVGLPSGVLNVVTGLGDEVGRPLIDDPHIQRISFTGSVGVGRRIATRAGEQLKRVTLELGGKSAQIVFEDADIEQAIRGILSGIFVSNGQSCVAGSRLLVHSRLHDDLVRRLGEAVANLRYGDPMEPATDVGPIANLPQFHRVQQAVDHALEDGARCVAGGSAVTTPDGGWYFKPTIFVGVTPDMRIAREEVFGPVLAVMRFDDEAEAIALANDSDMGLAAGVWTQDIGRAFRVSNQLQAGTVYVNNYRGVAPQSPCGGFKQSGWGRENGIEAMREFLQLKSVWIGLGALPHPYPQSES